MPAPRRFLVRLALAALVIAAIAALRDRLIAANYAKYGPFPLPHDDPAAV